MKKVIHIFIVGTGKVGTQFLKLISEKSELKTENGDFIFKIAGIANHSRMLINHKGINPADWKLNLLKTGEPAIIKSFISRMQKTDLTNSIFLDCTDGDEIVKYYDVILRSIPIVTPNKSANSGTYQKYLALKKTVKRFKTDFRYSANVGVGLPSLDVINSLLSGGDRITSIEGLFSSTMNYLLDKLLITNKKFSELLKEAHDKGLTEPDPRNDLNGIDTARKILILAREAGYKIEMSDIEIENLVPPILRNINLLDKFYNSIKIADSKFDSLKKLAVKTKRKLVYSARLRNNKVSVGIEMVDSGHPFYSASSNEKVVLFYSEFYNENPLIIKGQSGGAKATASVLVSDILKTVG
ncbi:MAG: hypothetical protein GYA14_05120 [Ignavibacteria bacterium]|nr:hypothetical protein [Ignavibacteria bacterium]